MPGVVVTSLTLRVEHGELYKKMLGEKILKVERRPRWSDENETETESMTSYREKDMGEAKALELLKELGFPHARRADYRAELPKAAYPEIMENEDPMTREGEQIGRYNRGRGGP